MFLFLNVGESFAQPSTDQTSLLLGTPLPKGSSMVSKPDLRLKNTALLDSFAVAKGFGIRQTDIEMFAGNRDSLTMMFSRGQWKVERQGTTNFYKLTSGNRSLLATVSYSGAVATYTAAQMEESPLFKEVFKGAQPDRKDADHFGYCVAISGDYAIVGTPVEDEDAKDANTLNDAGAVYIFERNAKGEWLLVQKLTAADRAAGDNFGCSVGISGNYCIVGAEYDDNDVTDKGFMKRKAGSAYLFERGPTREWRQVQKLFPPEEMRGSQDLFGCSVAISGTTTMVGAKWDDKDSHNEENLNDAGAAYFFERGTGGVWLMSQKVTATDRKLGANLGCSVSVSGNQAIAGASLENLDAAGGAKLEQSGAAYIFEKVAGGKWTEVQKITPSVRMPYAKFGESVSISDGAAIVGVPREPAGTKEGSAEGAAYLYERSENGKWMEVKRLFAGIRSQGDRFGFSVAISGDFAIAGAYQDWDDVQEANPQGGAGSVYVFHRENQGWGEFQKLTASVRKQQAWFGYAVAINGNNAVVGALNDDWTEGQKAGKTSGIAYMFQRLAWMPSAAR